MEFTIGVIVGALIMAVAVAVSITRDAENRIVNYTIVLAEEETATDTCVGGKYEAGKDINVTTRAEGGDGP
jgi:hypothetical protein